VGPDARVVGQEEQQANRVKELDAFGHKLCSFARFSELEVRGLNAGLCCWEAVCGTGRGSASAGFGKAI
jgi:hypothetical protein